MALQKGKRARLPTATSFLFFALNLQRRSGFLPMVTGRLFQEFSPHCAGACPQDETAPLGQLRGHGWGPMIPIEHMQDKLDFGRNLMPAGEEAS